jgi:hypothetical protein
VFGISSAEPIMLKYLLLAVILILILCVIYWTFFDNDKSKRKRAETLIDKSDGVFDDGARNALHELAAIRDPTPEDHIHRADIIRYNLLEGNLAAPTLGPDGIDARMQHRAAVGTMVQDYTRALDGIAHRQRIAQHHQIARHDIGDDFMLMQIIDLNNHIDGIQMNVADNDFEIAQMLGMFGDAVQHQAPGVQQNIVENRMTAAVAETGNKRDAINTALTKASTYTNMNQNVHDTKVNADLNITLTKLKNSCPEGVKPADEIADAHEYIRTGFDPEMPVNLRAVKIRNAFITLDVIGKGEKISTFSEREDVIFAYVWKRCYHASNNYKTANGDENRDLMRNAVVNMLADAVSPGTGNPLCINGRCARMLGSLATLDFDGEVGHALTFEAYRNQIFQETKDIVNDAISNAERSDDNNMQDVAAEYLGEEPESVDMELSIRFKREMKREIDNMLDSYNDKLGLREIDQLRQECYVYAMV